MVLCSLKNQLFLKVSTRTFFLDHLALKFIKKAFLKEVQKLIVEYIIDQFLFTRSQKKCYEEEYNILKEFVHTVFFGFIDVNRSTLVQNESFLFKNVICP